MILPYRLRKVRGVSCALDPVGHMPCTLALSALPSPHISAMRLLQWLHLGLSSGSLHSDAEKGLLRQLPHQPQTADIRSASIYDKPNQYGDTHLIVWVRFGIIRVIATTIIAVIPKRIVATAHDWARCVILVNTFQAGLPEYLKSVVSSVWQITELAAFSGVLRCTLVNPSSPLQYPHWAQVISVLCFRLQSLQSIQYGLASVSAVICLVAMPFLKRSSCLSV